MCQRSRPPCYGKSTDPPSSPPATPGSASGSPHFSATPSGRITFGFSSDLNQATIAALDAMLAWMQRLLGLQKVEALALASVVVNLRVTQVANEVWGVHAVLPHGALG